MYTSPRTLDFVPDENAVETFYRSARINPSKVALVDAVGGAELTAEQVRRLTLQVATVLSLEYGIRAGSVVLVSTHNSIYLQVLHHAVLALGAIVSPANVMYTPKELDYQIKSVNPALLVVNGPSSVAAAGPRAPAPTSVPSSSSAPLPPHTTLLTIISQSSNQPPSPIRQVAGDTPAYYCLSSGTSGLPKTVVLSHTNVAVNMLQWSLQDSELDLQNKTVACTLPMSHILALQCYVWMSPYLGCTVVIFPKFDLDMLLAAISSYKITSMAAVPPVVLALAKDPRVDNYDISSLKGVASAAAPLSESLIDAVEARLGIRVTQFYGQTESSPVTIGAIDTGTQGPLAREYKAGGIGWLMAGTQARLVDPETLEDSKSGRGELWIKGPQVMLGYLNNEEATRETLVDGWLRTGDVAEVTNGQFAIVDRIKELIKSKGHQVAPAELEGLLLSFDQVEDVAVIGVYNEEHATECARAYLVLKKGADVDAIVREFNASVSPHKRLFGGAVVVDSIPKSPSGKILRRLLRDMANGSGKPKL